jgi:hypothetical protein
MQPTRDSDDQGWGLKGLAPAGSSEGTDTTAPVRVEEGKATFSGGRGAEGGDTPPCVTEAAGWLRWVQGYYLEN